MRSEAKDPRTAAMTIRSSKTEDFASHLVRCSARCNKPFTARASPALAQQPSTAKPNILVIFGDDVGQTNISAYTDGRGGLQDAEHRPHRQGRHDVHRLLRGEQLHGGPLDLHHRAGLPAHRALQGRHPRRRRSACRIATSPSPRRSSRSAMPPDSSARTISATATNICRPSTASTSSSATSITSTPRRSRSGPTGRRTTRRSSRPTRRAACSRRPPTARSRTPARSTASGWRRSTTRRPPPRSTSCSGRSRPTSRSSPG